MVTLVAIIIIAILSATILMTSLNQNLANQAYIDKLQCEQACKGLFWSKYNEAITSGSNNLNVGAGTTFSVTGSNNKNYTCTITQPAAGQYSFNCS